MCWGLIDDTTEMKKNWSLEAKQRRNIFEKKEDKENGKGKGKGKRKKKERKEGRKEGRKLKEGEKMKETIDDFVHIPQRQNRRWQWSNNRDPCRLDSAAR